jgi:hypothetical protein
MQFYTKQHQTYCGIDMHARTMYVCILNQAGEILVHQNMKASPDMLLRGYPETVLAKKAALLDSWRISHLQRSAPTCWEMASLGRGIPRI